MIKRLAAGMLGFALLLFPGRSLIREIPSEVSSSPLAGLPISPQDFPVQKPKPDYWSSFFSRNTKTLGLKEDPALRELLKQPGIKWAVRTGMRHILD